MLAPTKKLNESALAPLAVYNSFLHSIILSALLPAFFKHSIPSPVLTHASLLQARASWPAPSSAVATVFQVSLLDTELQASEKAPESVSPTSENQSREKTVSALTWVARVMRAAEMRMVRTLAIVSCRSESSNKSLVVLDQRSPGWRGRPGTRWLTH